MLLVLLLGIVYLIVSPQIPRSDETSLSTQAQTVANHLRRAQTLALSQNQSLCVEAASAHYKITLAPGNVCSGSAINDPVTGQPYVVALGQNVQLTGTATLLITSQGVPATAAAYTLTTGDSSQSVAVSITQGSGLVTINNTP